MPANFPNSPTLNQVYTYNGNQWTWSGSTWQLTSAATITGATGPQGATGATGQQGTTGPQGATGIQANLTAVTTNIIPAANVTYDLGSSNFRWRDLYLSGNSLILGGATVTATGSAIALPAGSTVGGQSVASGGDVATGGGPKITAVTVTNASYNNLDDTAVDIAGGYIKITGTGFAAGCTVLINNTPATSTTYIGPTEVRAQVPATAAGTYMLYVINADGGVAIRVNGVTFSATPSWVTASDLAGYSLGDAISIQLAATGATTFALAQGSSLPTGLTLTSGGLLSGSVTGLENDTSYSFTITATDAELQDSPRTFSITITVQLQVSRSLRFNSADSTSLSWIPSRTGNLQTFTVSCWIKRSAITGSGNPIMVAGTDASDYFYINLTNTDTLAITTGENGTANANNVATSAVFRDVGAWYHVVINCDFSNATSTDRIRAYVNGVRQTLTGTFAAATFTGTRHNRAGITHYIGRWMNGSPYFSGYITEFYFIDGQALLPSQFADTNVTTGQYIPKKYTGTYGTNGFYLPFTDNSSVLSLGRNYQILTADPFWDQTVLLLNGTGTNNANNNTFTDSSTNAFAITRNGNTTQGRFSPFTQGGWSNYFDGTGDYLSVASNSAFDLTGDYTVECWFYANSFPTQPALFGIGSDAGGLVLTIVSSKVYAYINSTGNVFGSGGITLAINSWNHIAIVRSGSTNTCYITGSQSGTTYSYSGTVSSTGGVGIGRTLAGTSFNDWNGYISNFRIVKGTAVYTAAFAPPTGPLTAITNTSLLTCQSNRFKDNSTNNFTITRNGDARVVAFSPFTPTAAYSAAVNGGSGYFDGTGDYLVQGNSTSSFDLSTGDWTVDFWVYKSAASDGSIINLYNAANSTSGFSVWVNSSGVIKVDNGLVGAITTGGTIPLYSWAYISIVRSSGITTLYVNGVSAATTSQAPNVAQYGTFGRAVDGTLPHQGYIADLRIVKGTASAPSSVPTAPLTAVANTAILLNFVNGSIVDATGDSNLETVGDTKISTAQSKWGSSVYLDGTGDYLLTGPIQIAASNENFTLEYWFYATGNGSGWGYHLSTAATTGTNANSFFIGWEPSTGRLGGNWANASNRFPSGDATFAGTTCVLNTWYHVALVRISGVMKIYLNGTASATTWSVSDALGQGSGFGDRLAIGYNLPTNAYIAQGYIQDVRITRAARYTGNFTPPTTQFAYNQGDINYNQWVPTNFSVTAGAGNDSLLDVPTNWGVDTGLGGEVRGNYCTINALMQNTSVATISDGTLRAATGTSGISSAYMGTIGFSSGKWYWEVYVEAIGSNNMWIGVTKNQAYRTVDAYINTWAYNRLGQKTDNAATGSAYGAAYTTGDIIGIAVDADAGSITFYKNGASQGVAFSGLTMSSGVYTVGGSDNSAAMVFNYGQRPFAYAAPSGFKSLNTHNLPTPNVVKSNTAFDTLAYAGNGSTQNITTNFSPDFVWIKNRTTNYSHMLYDTHRGPSTGSVSKVLSSNATDVEGSVNDNSTYGYLSAFNSNGFTVTAGSFTGAGGYTNTTGQNYVAWTWDAGTASVVNTTGSIGANVRVNTTAGFSIVSWTGTGANATVGHGLNAVPQFIIVRNRDTVYNWRVWHKALSGTQLLYLNTADSTVTDAAMWNSATPTSSVFSLGTNGGVNESTKKIIAYCFAEVPGYSAFGSYTGNGSADGPFIYTGFRPAFILWKRSDTAGNNWVIQDRARSNIFNPADGEILPSSSAAESMSFSKVDLLSNGFKIRSTNAGENASSATYIYAAFAESPFKYARAR